MNERDSRLLAVMKHIPAGCWMSYGDVAKHAGLPGYHRLVVRLLGEAKEGALPWHRVLRADGRPGLPEGSPAYLTQLKRLAAEGVQVLNGRALTGRCKA